MSGIICCYKCQDRTVTCHSNCQKYISEKAEHDRLKAEERKSRPPLIHYGDFTGDDGLRRHKATKHKYKRR